MAYTQADLDALSAAITGGVKSVAYANGSKVEYQTLADMRALRADMKLEIAAAAAKAAPPLRSTVGVVMRR